MKENKKIKMFVKGISTEDFPENYVGRWSNNYTSEEPINCFERFSDTFDSDGSPIFLPKFDSEFSRTKRFCFENLIFLLAFGLGICEGVGEDSGHGIGHVDIRVGSCNCLTVFVFPCMCA